MLVNSKIFLAILLVICVISSYCLIGIAERKYEENSYMRCKKSDMFAFYSAIFAFCSMFLIFKLFEYYKITAILLFVLGCGMKILGNGFIKRRYLITWMIVVTLITHYSYIRELNDIYDENIKKLEIQLPVSYDIVCSDEYSFTVNGRTGYVLYLPYSKEYMFYFLENGKVKTNYVADSDVKILFVDNDYHFDKVTTTNYTIDKNTNPATLQNQSRKTEYSLYIPKDCIVALTN